MRSWLNWLDVLLVLLCVATLVLVTTGCSASRQGESVVDSIFLIIRNVVQIVRLAVNLRRYCLLCLLHASGCTPPPLKHRRSGYLTGQKYPRHEGT